MYGLGISNDFLLKVNLEKNELHFHFVSFSLQTAKKISAIYGDGTITENTVHKSFSRLRRNNFDLEDRRDFGRSVVIDGELLKILIRKNPGHTTSQRSFTYLI